MGAAPTIVRAHGPLALERELVRLLAAEREARRADPTLLAAPLVLVVPSDGLRVHVAGLAARAVGALAGLRFVTLAGLAHDVLARAGQPVPRGADAAAILLERAARSAFPGADERFVPAAVASITDLLDAGFEDGHLAAVLEALENGDEQAPLARAALETASAVARAAALVRSALDAQGLVRAADVPALAGRALRAAPDSASFRAVWLHGFTDATGLQADFLAALADLRPTTVLWDDAASAPRYGSALRARFRIPLAPRRDAPATPPESFRARGAEAEAREALRRVRRLLDAGTTPERVALVARAIAPCAADLRVHARRLAVPISSDGARGPATKEARRLQARLEVLADPREVALDRWFAAQEQRPPDALALEIGLRSLGAGRLGDVADLDAAAALGGRSTLRLPLRVARERNDAAQRRDAQDETREQPGPGEDSAADEPEEPAAGDGASRWLPRAAIEAAIEAARAFAQHAVDARPEAPAAEHAQRLSGLLARLGAPAGDPLLDAVHALAADLGPAFRTTPAEFHAALARRASALVDTPLAGSGGGVQVLDAAAARARGFEHVFVLGLNAGVFPVAAHEDPLLSDEARARLAPLLPDLAPRRARTEEESAVFAQLLACAEHVTLSWLVADDEDELLSPSPLLDSAGLRQPEVVEVCASPTTPPAGERVAAPLHEHALCAAREGTREEAEGVLALALSAARAAHGLDPGPAARIAAARAAAARELDRAPGPPEPLGPFFGAAGAGRLEVRTRRELAVTTLENVARCPWQAFLGHVLGLKPPLDPLLDAPTLDARATGSVAHALLEETAPAQRVRLEDVEEQPGAPPAWPSDEVLRARAHDHAARILREEGRHAPGLDALVAARALELVASARRLDVEDGSLRVLAAEVDARWPLAAGRTLVFRADRAERADGRLRLVDWKSGRVFGDFAKPATRAKHAREGLRSGDHLQAFVYALAAGEGRYVALHPDFGSDDRRVFALTTDTEGLGADFEQALEQLLATWDAGAFFPRLEEHGGTRENVACAHCELTAACVRGDSGARLRFAALARRTEDPPAGTHEALVRGLLALRAPPPEPAATDPDPGATPVPRRSKGRPKDAQDAP
ncbi:MAG: PD-(D/E)XK nuclease family protein [Planctomycetes bacterium]|nr:PD-(D/E)XK nuclease family protein [Planctomycetota bacterium]